jgi:muramoyltetrapeptide carboxypeptidase
MKPILPFALKPGDLIGVISPAGIVDRRALKRGIDALTEMGFCVKLGTQALARESFFAGDHRTRQRDLNAMIHDRKVKAIFCSRGGYGSVHLLEGLDFESLRRQAKIVMGASDLTVLLNAIHARTGLITFHGPMVATNFSKGRAGIHLHSFTHALMDLGGNRPRNPWSIPLRRQGVIHQGRAKGRLVGGCLSLLVSTLGTSYELDTTHGILFVEDVNESPYRIDRMLKQLEDSGKLRHLRGIVIGDMLNCVDEKHPQWTARRVFEDYFRHFEGPIAMGLSSGHTRSPFVTLPIGSQVTLETRSTPALIIEERTVR